MVELVTVAGILARRILAIDSTHFVVVFTTKDHELVDLVRAAIVADRVGRVATKHGTDLVYEFLADLIKLLTVEVVVASIVRRVLARDVEHFVVLANDTNTGHTILALELEGLFKERDFFGIVIMATGKGTHQRTNGPNWLSRLPIELQAVDIVPWFRAAADPLPLSRQRKKAQNVARVAKCQ